MKKITIAITFIVLSVLACQTGATPAAPNNSSVETIVASTLQAYTQEAPKGISISFQNVSFVIPDGLASGATSELAPQTREEDSGPWGVAPEHVEFALTGYLIPRQGFGAVVHIYPAQEYAAVNSWANSSLTRLQAVLANPSILTNDTLPTIPFNGAAAQQYAAQAKLIPFNGGNGVRMLSQYSQFPGPIIKDNSFYHYEGLTADGKYMVAIAVPITLPLQSTPENTSADGVPYPNDLTDTAGLTAYFQGITNKLNSANPDTFYPALGLLDALVQSIIVK